MNTLVRLQELMQELGPSTAVIEWLVQESENSWSIGMTSGPEIGVSFCASPDRLLLSAMIGKPEAPDRQATYTTMLCSNLLYAEHHALRVALTGPEGDLMLISESAPEAWTVAEIWQATERFFDLACRFADVISSIDAALPVADSTSPHRLRA